MSEFGRFQTNIESTKNALNRLILAADHASKDNYFDVSVPISIRMPQAQITAELNYYSCLWDDRPDDELPVQVDYLLSTIITIFPHDIG